MKIRKILVGVFIEPLFCLRHHSFAAACLLAFGFLREFRLQDATTNRLLPSIFWWSIRISVKSLFAFDFFFLPQEILFALLISPFFFDSLALSCLMRFLMGFSISHVILPPDIAKLLPKNQLLTEKQWRALGIQQSPGWVHYAIHRPEPHIMLFRRKLGE